MKKENVEKKYNDLNKSNKEVLNKQRIDLLGEFKIKYKNFKSELNNKYSYLEKQNEDLNNSNQTIKRKHNIIIKKYNKLLIENKKLKNNDNWGGIF